MCTTRTPFATVQAMILPRFWLWSGSECENKLLCEHYRHNLAGSEQGYFPGTENVEYENYPEQSSALGTNFYLLVS